MRRHPRRVRTPRRGRDRPPPSSPGAPPDALRDPVRRPRPPRSRHRPWYRGLTSYQWFVFTSPRWAGCSTRWTSSSSTWPGSRRSRSCSKLPPSDPAVAHQQRLCHFDLHGRLGDRRARLRHPGRPDRPRQDDAADDPALLALHRPERPVGGGLGLRVLSVPDGPGRRGRVRRGRLAGGRGHARPGPADALGWLQALSAVGNMIGGRHQHGPGGRNRGRRFLLAAHVPRRRAARPAGHPDLLPPQGARALEEGRGGGRRTSPGAKHQPRLAVRALRRPALAAEHDRRHAPGLRRRRRALGDRLLQPRPDPHGLRGHISRNGA